MISITQNGMKMNMRPMISEESDESIYWLEMLLASNLTSAPLVNALLDEGNQILSITVASIKTVRTRNS